MHNTKPIFTAQFHPEAKGGPTDTEVIKGCYRKYLNVVVEFGKGIFTGCNSAKVELNSAEAFTETGLAKADCIRSYSSCREQ